ncbi:hypothetical protein VULLAG_LOCUS7992 [Vulpes lagopus]
MQERRSSRARVGPSPCEAQCPSVLQRRGAATCGDSSERRKELGPALPEMYGGGVCWRVVPSVLTAFAGTAAPPGRRTPPWRSPLVGAPPLSPASPRSGY